MAKGWRKPVSTAKGWTTKASKRAVERNRFNQLLKGRMNREGETPGVPEDFKRKVRLELLEAHMRVCDLTCISDPGMISSGDGHTKS